MARASNQKMEDLHFYFFVKVPCLQAEYNQTFSILNPFTADRKFLCYSPMVHLWGGGGGGLLLTIIGSSKDFSILKSVLSLPCLGVLVHVVCYRCNTLLTELTPSSCQRCLSLSSPLLNMQAEGQNILGQEIAKFSV